MIRGNRWTMMMVGCMVACAEDPTDTGSPQTASSECEDGICFVSGVIEQDQTWTADTQWVLRGGVFVGDDENPTTLTIEPGTTIYGESSTGGMLVVRRHSRLVAEGTTNAPIVFSSSKAVGDRARGDWGGLILNGRAPINACKDPESADCEAFGEGGTGWYGGNDPADDSGVLSYVRVEFAGALISPENELNGIALQGVGRGTTIENVHVHMSDDDGIEFFGGTAQAKYLITTGIGDDNIDWTDGWQGKVQFAVAQQHSDDGDNGLEGDNNGENNGVTPVSNPIFSNVTLVGSPKKDHSDLGMLLREGTAGSFHNMVVVGWNDACLDIDNDATWANADTHALVLRDSLMHCATPFDEDDDGQSVETWFQTDDWGNALVDPLLADPHNPLAPDFTPDQALVAGAQVPDDNFFDAVDFKGGMGPDQDWTTWTAFPAN